MALYGLLACAVLGRALASSTLVVSAPGQDLDSQYLPWAMAGFARLARGDLPLWNAHAFGGVPFLGNLQAALLSPPNWVHLVVGPGSAFDLVFAFDFVVAACGAYAFARELGASAQGAAIGGAVFPLSTPWLAHLHPGHVPYLAVVSWAPAVFALAVRLARAPTLGAFSALASVVAMQALGGYPQPAHATGLVALVVFVAIAWPRGREAIGSLAAFGAAYALGLAVAATPIVAALAAERESWRHGGLPNDLATSFALPPENLVTMVAPRVLGDDLATPYLGAWVPWEASCFLGVFALALALFGVRRGPEPARRLLAPAALVCLFLAMGDRGPLFGLALRVVPGLASFRVPARFTAEAVALTAPLVAYGLDALVRGLRPAKSSVGVALAGAVALAAAAAVVASSAAEGVHGAFGRAVSFARRGGKVGNALPVDPDALAVAIERSAHAASTALVVAAATLAALALALAWARRARAPAFAFGVFALAELVAHGVTLVPVHAASSELPAAFRSAIAELPADARVVDPNPVTANLGLVAGAREVGGYDPLVPDRFARLAHHFAGLAPETFAGFVEFRGRSRLLRLLRARAAFVASDAPHVVALPPGLARLELVPRAERVDDRAERFRRLSDPSFDPHATVLLEVAPPLAEQPDVATGARAEVVRDEIDELEIAAATSAPAYLLVSDAWSSGWVARPAARGPQDRYDVLPADHVLMAIPLAAGEHRISLRYEPAGLAAAKVVSLASLALLLACVVVAARRSWRARSRSEVK